MSLLLKSVWRGVLRPLVRSPLNARSVASLSERSQCPSSDAITVMLRAADSPADVLAAVTSQLPAMTHRHMLQALRCIFQLQKADNFSQDNDSLIKDPAFGLLCQNFKKHVRSLDVNEAIEAVKVLTFLGVPPESLLVQTLLQLIRCQINMLNIRQIMFVDFLLSRFDTKNHLVDALKLALPLAFQIHLPLELDNQDLPLLKDMLAYCCSHDLPDRCINNVVTGLLLHDQKIDAQIAKSIIWSLCQTNCTENVYPTRVQLLHICYDILTQRIDQLTYDDVLRTAAKVKGRILEKHPEYYHEQLMDAIANYMVKNNVDFEKSLLVARVLSRMAHTHLSLIEYLCQLAASSQTTLSNARTNILFGFVNCLSNNNFTPPPDQWDLLRRQISTNPVLDARSSALPWAKFCLELASLGHFEDKLLDRVFSKEYLTEHLKREHNTLDYMQLFTLHEAVNTFYSQRYQLPAHILEKAKEMYPMHGMTEQLEESLASGLGGNEYLVRNVVLPNGIVADLLMCLKGGYPIALPVRSCNEKIPIEKLLLPRGGIPVCIMNFNQGCFSMNSSRLRGIFRLVLDILEKQGYAAVAVNVNEWLAAPAHERTPYLMREVGYKCGEIGMKLSIT
ncbi:uncharacterized protein LOC126375261 [Pectinophora gossypiella]|nr:uncharacterized protein LOC126375261 [Pectinophora gossypiella]XP_049878143.1 uncharacterized protein LOC126375261 [Pectinophora gossypiella]